jgi:alpha-N-arabinofuranosidase
MNTASSAASITIATRSASPPASSSTSATVTLSTWPIYAQTVNVIGCIKTTKTGAFLDTTAMPFVLYRAQFGTTPFPVTGNKADASLDVSAAKTEDGRPLTVGIVNPNAKPQTIHVKLDRLEVGDKADVWRIAGDDPLAINTVENEQVGIREEHDVAFADTLTVPAYSASVYRIPSK